LKNTTLIFILLFFFIGISNAQSNKSGFRRLSSPEKCWVLFHPFKAKRAYRISLQAQKVSDSIGKTHTLDQDRNGGQVDAFRHAFWMATLAQKIGRRSAKSLGKAHEKGNYKQFKKNKIEDGTLPDQPSSEMDLFNNSIGIAIYKENKKASQKELISSIIKDIQQGNLKTLKKDNNGNYLDCQGNLLPSNKYYGKWENSKCLISSERRPKTRI
tara:strand:+ start:23538 stop:24176 length:639 start_codon:yes stop_codon:yes gene_type:complete